MAKSKGARARVTGIGGIFLKSKSPLELAAWYRDHLGLSVGQNGQVATWSWRPTGRSARRGNTVWAALAEEDRDWGGKRSSAQVNYRVDDLDRLRRQLKRAGVKVDPHVEESTYGRFGWATDPEGNRFELWEPPGRYRSAERHQPMR